MPCCTLWMPGLNAEDGSEGTYKKMEIWEEACNYMLGHWWEPGHSNVSTFCPFQWTQYQGVRAWAHVAMYHGDAVCRSLKKGGTMAPGVSIALNPSLHGRKPAG